MTILITADWHLNDNPRDRYRHSFQDHLLKIIAKHKIGALLVLGDLTDDKDHHGAVLVNEIVGYLKASVAATKAHRVIILQGNHDYIDPSNAFFKFAGSAIEGIEWIWDPTKLYIKGIGSCLFLPHTRDYKRDWGVIVANKNNAYDMIFTHNTFTGARSSSGRELAGIPTDVFLRDNSDSWANQRRVPVISGDVHVPQNIGPVTYVGAPYTIDFGDRFKPRMLLIEDGVVSAIPCPGPQKRLIKAIDITDARRKLEGLPKDDMVKVRIGWDSTKFDKWAAARKDLVNWATEKGIDLKGVEPILYGRAKAKKYKVPTKPATDTEVLADYCKANSVDKLLNKVGRILMKG